METTWTESAEAALAEQNWQRMERERHQRVLHQLKLELQQANARRKTTVAVSSPSSTADPAAKVVAPIAIGVARPVGSEERSPQTGVRVTPPESAKSLKRERVFRQPQRTVLSVQIR